MAAATDLGPGEQNSRSEWCGLPRTCLSHTTQARTSSVCLPGAGVPVSPKHAPATTHMAVPKDALPPMSTIAWSHNMAGDARPPLELRGVLLIEANTRLPENPHRNTRGTRWHSNKFTVILLRSR